MTTLFEQEKFGALSDEMKSLHAEMEKTECYFKFLELQNLRDSLLDQIEKCTAVTDGNEISIKELAA